MPVYYSGLKFIGFAKQLASLQQGMITEPVHVRIKPTNRCGHQCWYCAYRANHLELGETMSAKDQIPQEKMFEIIDDLASMAVKAVTFSGGGEPLSYPAIGESILRLAKANIKVGVLTHGALMKDPLTEILTQHATWVRISIDAWDDASYAAIRRVKHGEFSQVINNMKNFSKMGGNCTLGACFVITAENHHHLYDICALLKDVGVKHVKLSAVIVANEAAENTRYHDAIRQTTLEQLEKAQELEDDSFQLIHHYNDLTNRFAILFRQCAYLRFVTVIGADCNVYTCHDKAYNPLGLLGSIRDRSFKQFWFSEENKQRILNFDPRASCHHHCMAQKINEMIQHYVDTDPDHATFV